MSQLSANLRYLMTLRGVDSQQALHRASGVSQASIGNILEHRHSPSFSIITRLAKTLGVEPWQLVGPPHLLKGLPANLLGVVANYVKCDAQGQETIDRVAEAQARTARPDQ